MGRYLGAERVPDDRGFRPRWNHETPAPGEYGPFVVDRVDSEQLGAGEYFGAIVDYGRQFPDMPPITRVFERLGDEDLRLWMTDGPQEVSMMIGLTKKQRGDVLVTGLGLGIVQQLLMARPEVASVTTIEARPDLSSLHEESSWFHDRRHELVTGDATALLGDLVGAGDHDGYVLDHWETLGEGLDEKVAFLRLLDELGQGDRPVSMWGFWWEVQRAGGSESPDTRRLLEEIERCVSCGAILGTEARDGAGSNFWVPGGHEGRCEMCAELGTPLPPGDPMVRP